MSRKHQSKEMEAKFYKQHNTPTTETLNAMADFPKHCTCRFMDHPALGTVLVWDDCPHPAHPRPATREKLT